MHFQIASCAEYLGIFLGPDTASQQWLAPCNKFIDRVSVVSNSGAAASILVKTYNSKVVSTLSYPAQFLPPPDNIIKLEKYAFTKNFQNTL